MPHPGKRISPQRKWALKMKKMGRCTRCGEPRNHYLDLCDFHQGQFTSYMRRYRAAKRKVAA